MYAILCVSSICLENDARYLPSLRTFSGVWTVPAPPGGFDKVVNAEPVDLKFAIQNKIVFLLGTLPWRLTSKRERKCRCVKVTESPVLKKEKKKNLSMTKAHCFAVHCSMYTKMAYFQLLKASEPSLPMPQLKKLNSVAWVRKRTIPTERPQLVGTVSVNFCG
jgi:hypothetical protein